MAREGDIRKRVDDARFNISHGKYEAALALLLVAIDGSAKKVYPDRIKSILNPKKEMGNRERYTRFLGVRLREVLGFGVHENAYYEGKLIPISNSEESLEEKIYCGLRCNELHESGLPDDLRYVYLPESSSSAYSLQFTENNVVFSAGLLSLLEEVIVKAPCNGKEFGINHYRLRAKSDDGFKKFIEFYEKDNENFSLVINTLKRLISKVGPQIYSTEEHLIETLLNKNLVKLGGGATRLFFNPFNNPICMSVERLSPFGLEVIKVMLKEMEFVDIAQ